MYYLNFRFQKLWFVLLLFYLLGCQPEKGTTKPDFTKNNNLPSAINENLSLLEETAVLHRNIICKTNQSVSYALYLPNKWNGKKKIPVAFIFDPHADGALPIGLYKNLADKYQYIFVASNNSRNGLPWDTITAIANTLMREVYEKYPVDSTRIYTMGFSGGARVAAALAIARHDIRAVTAIGAGFQNSNANLTYNFDFFGMAAHGDFNLTEMESLDQMLNQTTMPHYIHLYDGAHEWASADEMENAFVWHEFQAMKRTGRMDNSLVKDYTKKSVAKIAVAKKRNDVVGMFNSTVRLVKFTEGLQDVSLYQKQWQQLADSAPVKLLEQQRQHLQQEEIGLTKQYWKNLKTQTLKWWKLEITKIKKVASKKRNEYSRMNQRILGFLGLAVYMQASDAVKKADVANAEKLLNIYQWLEPDNAEQHYLRAVWLGGMDKKEEAILALEKSIALGFKDEIRWKAEANFQHLKDESRFLKLRPKPQIH